MIILKPHELLLSEGHPKRTSAPKWKRGSTKSGHLQNCKGSEENANICTMCDLGEFELRLWLDFENQSVIFWSKFKKWLSKAAELSDGFHMKILARTRHIQSSCKAYALLRGAKLWSLEHLTEVMNVVAYWIHRTLKFWNIETCMAIK